jgi:hypothetical protein
MINAVQYFLTQWENTSRWGSVFLEIQEKNNG